MSDASDPTTRVADGAGLCRSLNEFAGWLAVARQNDSAKMVSEAVEIINSATLRAAQAEAEVARLTSENDHLRASLANRGGACPYCTLPKEDWAKCASGFPGCARADDAMLCPNVGASLEADAEVARLKDEIAGLRAALKPFAGYAADMPGSDFGEGEIGEYYHRGLRCSIRTQDLRAARTALEASHGE